MNCQDTNETIEYQKQYNESDIKAISSIIRKNFKEELKVELKAELKVELKAELKAELKEELKEELIKEKENLNNKIENEESNCCKIDSTNSNVIVYDTSLLDQKFEALNNEIKITVKQEHFNSELEKLKKSCKNEVTLEILNKSFNDLLKNFLAKINPEIDNINKNLEKVIKNQETNKNEIMAEISSLKDNINNLVSEEKIDNIVIQLKRDIPDEVNKITVEGIQTLQKSIDNQNNEESLKLHTELEALKKEKNAMLEEKDEFENNNLQYKIKLEGYEKVFTEYKAIFDKISEDEFVDLRANLGLKNLDEYTSLFTLGSILLSQDLSNIYHFYTERKKELDNNDIELFDLINCYYRKKGNENNCIIVPAENDKFNRDMMYDPEAMDKKFFNVDKVYAPYFDTKKGKLRALVKGK